MQYLFLILSGIGLLYVLWGIKTWWEERLFLRQVLLDLNGKVPIDSLEDLIRIKGFLNSNISFDSDKKLVKRPLLRHTAKQILEMRYGFCGENARVANLLFSYGGLRSNRIYLVTPKWEHVALEHKWEGAWCYFDGHYDPMLPFEDSMVGNIDPSDWNSIPNEYGENPYTDLSRIKIFRKIPGLRSLAQMRMSNTLMIISESPQLIKAIFALALVVLVLALQSVFYG